MAVDVLHHDDGGIDQQAEIERAQRQQVGALAACQHQHDGEEKGEGDGRRHHQRATEIAEEEVLDHQDEDHALDDVLHHRLGGDLHQVLAVIERVDLHPRRQHAAGIDPSDLGLHAADGRQGLFAAPHQHGRQHHVVVFLMPGNAEPRGIADLDGGEVGQQHRHAAVGRDHHAADVVQVADQADALHHGGLRPDADGAGADGRVAGAHGLDHLWQGQPMRRHARQVDDDVVAFRQPAEGGDVDHPGDTLEAAVQHPVLQGLQVGQRIAGRPDQPVAHDLADRAERRDLRLRALRQPVQLAQPVQHLLQRLVVGVVEVELYPHVRKAEQAGRAHRGQVGQPGHRHFHGDGDVALDLLGRLAGILGDDDDLRRHRIGIGLDVEPGEADQTDHDEGEEQQDHQRPALQRKGDDLAHVWGSRQGSGRLPPPASSS